jgi:hypothetical protein
VGALTPNSFQKDGLQNMSDGMTIERLQRRYDRLYERADAIKKWLEENESLNSILDGAIIKQYRLMDAYYKEASTISICLETFRESCYEPMGPLI